MTRYFANLFIALTLLTGKAIKAQDSEELVPQIKVVRAQLWYVSSTFFEKLDCTISKFNETYNENLVDYELKEDLPLDSYLNFDVYVTDSEYENSTLLLSEQIPICEDSPKRALFPGYMVPEADMADNCLKKGLSSHHNMGHFRFELLVPNIHEIGDYYYYHQSLHSQQEMFNNLTFYSEWGYLDS